MLFEGMQAGDYIISISRIAVLYRLLALAKSVQNQRAPASNPNFASELSDSVLNSFVARVCSALPPSYERHPLSSIFRMTSRLLRACLKAWPGLGPRAEQDVVTQPHATIKCSLDEREQECKHGVLKCGLLWATLACIRACMNALCTMHHATPTA